MNIARIDTYCNINNTLKRSFQTVVSKAVYFYVHFLQFSNQNKDSCKITENDAKKNSLYANSILGLVTPSTDSHKNMYRKTRFQ